MFTQEQLTTSFSEDDLKKAIRALKRSDNMQATLIKVKAQQDQGASGEILSKRESGSSARAGLLESASSVDERLFGLTPLGYQAGVEVGLEGFEGESQLDKGNGAGESQAAPGGSGESQSSETTLDQAMKTVGKSENMKAVLLALCETTDLVAPLDELPFKGRAKMGLTNHGLIRVGTRDGVDSAELTEKGRRCVVGLELGGFCESELEEITESYLDQAQEGGEAEAGQSPEGKSTVKGSEGGAGQSGAAEVAPVEVVGQAEVALKVGAALAADARFVRAPELDHPEHGLAWSDELSGGAIVFETMGFSNPNTDWTEANQAWWDGRLAELYEKIKTANEGNNQLYQCKIGSADHFLARGMILDGLVVMKASTLPAQYQFGQPSGLLIRRYKNQVECWDLPKELRDAGNFEEAPLSAQESQAAREKWEAVKGQRSFIGEGGEVQTEKLTADQAAAVVSEGVKVWGDKVQLGDEPKNQALAPTALKPWAEAGKVDTDHTLDESAAPWAGDVKRLRPRSKLPGVPPSKSMAFGPSALANSENMLAMVNDMINAADFSVEISAMSPRLAMALTSSSLAEKCVRKVRDHKTMVLHLTHRGFEVALLAGLRPDVDDSELDWLFEQWESYHPEGPEDQVSDGEPTVKGVAGGDPGGSQGGTVEAMTPPSEKASSPEPAPGYADLLDSATLAQVSQDQMSQHWFSLSRAEQDFFMLVVETPKAAYYKLAGLKSHGGLETVAFLFSSHTLSLDEPKMLVSLSAPGKSMANSPGFKASLAFAQSQRGEDEVKAPVQSQATAAEVDDQDQGELTITQSVEADGVSLRHGGAEIIRLSLRERELLQAAIGIEPPGAAPLDREADATPLHRLWASGLIYRAESDDRRLNSTQMGRDVARLLGLSPRDSEKVMDQSVHNLLTFNYPIPGNGEGFSAGSVWLPKDPTELEANLRVIKTFKEVKRLQDLDLIESDRPGVRTLDTLSDEWLVLRQGGGLLMCAGLEGRRLAQYLVRVWIKDEGELDKLIERYEQAMAAHGASDPDQAAEDDLLESLLEDPTGGLPLDQLPDVTHLVQGAEAGAMNPPPIPEKEIFESLTVASIARPPAPEKISLDGEMIQLIQWIGSHDGHQVRAINATRKSLDLGLSSLATVRLVEDGLVEESRDDHQEYPFLLTLTPKGLAVFRATSQSHLDNSAIQINQPFEKVLAQGGHGGQGLARFSGFGKRPKQARKWLSKFSSVMAWVESENRANRTAHVLKTSDEYPYVQDALDSGHCVALADDENTVSVWIASVLDEMNRLSEVSAAPRPSALPAISAQQVHENAWMNTILELTNRAEVDGLFELAVRLETATATLEKDHGVSPLARNLARLIHSLSKRLEQMERRLAWISQDLKEVDHAIQDRPDSKEKIVAALANKIPGVNAPITREAALVLIHDAMSSPDGFYPTMEGSALYNVIRGDLAVGNVDADYMADGSVRLYIPGVRDQSSPRPHPNPAFDPDDFFQFMNGVLEWNKVGKPAVVMKDDKVWSLARAGLKGGYLVAQDEDDTMVSVWVDGLWNSQGQPTGARVSSSDEVDLDELYEKILAASMNEVGTNVYKVPLDSPELEALQELERQGKVAVAVGGQDLMVAWVKWKSPGQPRWEAARQWDRLSEGGAKLKGWRRDDGAIALFEEGKEPLSDDGALWDQWFSGLVDAISETNAAGKLFEMGELGEEHLAIMGMIEREQLKVFQAEIDQRKRRLLVGWTGSDAWKTHNVYDTAKVHSKVEIVDCDAKPESNTSAASTNASNVKDNDCDGNVSDVLEWKRAPEFDRQKDGAPLFGWRHEEGAVMLARESQDPNTFDEATITNWNNGVKKIRAKVTRFDVAGQLFETPLFSDQHLALMGFLEDRELHELRVKTESGEWKILIGLWGSEAWADHDMDQYQETVAPDHIWHPAPAFNVEIDGSEAFAWRRHGDGAIKLRRHGQDPNESERLDPDFDQWFNDLLTAIREENACGKLYRIAKDGAEHNALRWKLEHDPQLQSVNVHEGGGVYCLDLGFREFNLWGSGGGSKVTELSTPVENPVENSSQDDQPASPKKKEDGETSDLTNLDGGADTIECDMCEQVYTREALDELEHLKGYATTYPPSVDYKCANCGATFNVEVTPGTVRDLADDVLASLKTLKVIDKYPESRVCHWLLVEHTESKARAIFCHDPEHGILFDESGEGEGVSLTREQDFKNIGSFQGRGPTMRRWNQLIKGLKSNLDEATDGF